MKAKATQENKKEENKKEENTTQENTTQENMQDKVKDKAMQLWRKVYLFFEDQALKLLGIRACNVESYERSFIVGFSSLMVLILPWSYLYWRLGSSAKIDYMVYGLLALTSFSSDYIFVNTKKYPITSCYVAFIDNWAVTLAILYNVYKFFKYAAFNGCTALSLFLVPISLALLYASRQINTQERWVVVHTLWHVVAVTIALSVLELQYCAQ